MSSGDQGVLFCRKIKFNGAFQPVLLAWSSKQFPIKGCVAICSLNPIFYVGSDVCNIFYASSGRARTCHGMKGVPIGKRTLVFLLIQSKVPIMAPRIVREWIPQAQQLYINYSWRSKSDMIAKDCTTNYLLIYHFLPQCSVDIFLL